MGHNNRDTSCHSCSCGKDKAPVNNHFLRKYWRETVCFVILAAGLAIDHIGEAQWFEGWLRALWYAAAYLPVALPVMKEGWETLRRGDFFTEYTLMVVATIGAFAIGEYPEGVAVMLFYAVGEIFQHAALDKARRNIRSLLALRPSSATVLRGGEWVSVLPGQVEPGETVRVKVGEQVPLDSEMLSPSGSFNTSALTGESKPRTLRAGETVLAGMVNLEKVVEMRVTSKYADSSLSRILDMVEHATARKARTELMIRKFARVYTPIVFGLAVVVALLPVLFVENYVFSEWLYRGLIFLVVSCPCALVISVPLGYFGGIGAASHAGILFKGSNFLDVMARVNTVVMDKTGTLTEGVFEVQQIDPAWLSEDELIAVMAALESNSTHPIAKAIAAKAGKSKLPAATDIEEIAGYGLRGKVGGEEVLVGNAKLLHKFGVPHDEAIEQIEETVVVCAIGGRYAGCVIIADRIKEDAPEAVAGMRRSGVKLLAMLSGDNDRITQKVARQLGLDEVYGGLLPEQKAQHLERIKNVPGRVTAFVGDGINDAPVLALSDVGIAMGALGSQAAIETADVVIQTDQPSKIAVAMRIGRATRSVVTQNIVMAMGVKIVVMGLGAIGIANMWAAVFADVGVALLAILNAIRIQRMDFRK